MQSQTLAVARGKHQIHAEVTPGEGAPLVLMHGFPDNLHLYDRVMPHLSGHRPVLRFDFLGWGRSDKPDGWPYTATNQVGDLDAAIASAASHLDVNRVVLVAHDASGPPAIDWALDHPERIERLVLLNTYYHWNTQLRRPPAIALYSTPVLRVAARAVMRRRPDLDRRLYDWQVGRFIHDPQIRKVLVPQLYQEFLPSRNAFWRLNDDLLGTVVNRRRRLAQVRQFAPPVQLIFGADDRYLNPNVARNLAGLFPHSQLHLMPEAGHYVQVDQPEHVAELILNPTPDGRH